MRKFVSFFSLALFLAVLYAALPNSLFAQDADPPGRVARLNFIQGSVSYQVSGDSTWVDADPNRPLTVGDNLWADKDSRGEVHIGSNAIRLSSETGISFLTLDDRTIQLQLAQGRIEVHSRNFQAGDAFEIDTPNLSFTLTSGGEYMIATDPNGGSTSILVREGQGQVTGGGDSWDLHAGQQYTFNGTDQVSYDAMDAPGFDDFEAWCQDRDQRENNSLSAKYVSRDVDGYYDLDQYGDWGSDPDYGMVWVPRGVAIGWAPYHVGHWVYIAPWGWTWVDSEPWGFAPFHYGRWVYASDRWGWVPGPLVVRPVYAPALVGFVGGGGFGFSVSFGGGFNGVGWFPLGPRDVFVPGYRCSPRYFQTINVTNTRVVNVTQVTNVYNTVVVNRNVSRLDYTYAHNSVAVTAVSRETFVNARPVGGAAVRVTSEQIEGAHTIESAPIAPTRASYVSASARISTARPAVPIAQRSVVVRLNPAVSTRAGFGDGNQNRSFERQPASQSFNNTQPPARGNSNNQPPASTNGSAMPPSRVNNNSAPPPATGGNTMPPAHVSTNNVPPSNNTAPAQTSRDGFHPFQPPSHNNGNANANPAPQSTAPTGAVANSPNNSPGNNPNRDANNGSDQQRQNGDRSSMRYAPPVQAKDGMYDVHPPLNNKDGQAPSKKDEKRPPKDNKKDQSDDKKH
jgi:hypothetical protein